MELTPTNKKNDIRCPVCLKEFFHGDITEEGKPCPNCKSRTGFEILEHDGYIKINWQQLRVLVAYSSRWLRQFDPNKQGNPDAVKAFNNLVERLKQYQPEGGLPIIVDEDEAKIDKTNTPVKSPYFL